MSTQVCNNNNYNNNNNNSNSQVHFIECEYRQCPNVATLAPTNNIESSLPHEAHVLLPQSSSPSATRIVPKQIKIVAPLQKIFIDDLTERRRLWRVPWFILLMCFIQIAFHVIANDCLQQRLIFIPAFRYEYWRYFTYMLLHSDLLHLVLNLCLQCLIGFCLELEQGHCRTGCVYIAGGISGSLVTAWLQPQLSLLGASAGVYALLMSHIPHLVKNFAHLPYRYVRIVALLILSLSDIGFTTFHFIVNHNTHPKICLEAHVAGGMAGLLCGFIIYQRGRVSHGCGNRLCCQ